jgi:hypothetical protein
MCSSCPIWDQGPRSWGSTEGRDTAEPCPAPVLLGPAIPQGRAEVAAAPTSWVGWGLLFWVTLNLTLAQWPGV